MTANHKRLIALGGVVLFVLWALNRRTIAEALAPVMNLNYTNYNTPKVEASSLPLVGQPTGLGIGKTTSGCGCQHSGYDDMYDSFESLADYFQDSLRDIQDEFYAGVIKQVPDYVEQYFNNPFQGESESSDIRKMVGWETYAMIDYLPGANYSSVWWKNFAWR